MRKQVLSVLSIVILASLLLASCAAPQPEVKTVEVEKVVVETKEVIKEVVKEVAVVATAAPEAEGYARNETLYTSGTQWGPPSSWNPFNTGNYAMGTIGLCYETLFIYDPLTDEYKPWLAENGTWVNDTTYEVKVRQGVTWSDGEPFTAEDIKFTFDLGKTAAVNFSPVWNWLESVDVVDESTLNFTFSETLYQEWASYLYTVPMVPEHIWASKSPEDVTAGANEGPIGTGPYTYETHDQSKMVWVKNENWWAKSALDLDPAPKRIVDIVNGSNNVALSLVLQGGLDLSNNFLPGIATLVNGGYGVKTYYPTEPYMLSANTAWLLLNTTKKPMDDAAFRRAVAYAIDTDQIVKVVYGNIVQKADPTGLLPIWDQYIDKDLTAQKGFSYDAAKAKQILAEAGYKDTDGDSFVEAPDGSKIELSVIVPNGWSDWMESIKVIAKGCQEAGINVQTAFPDYGGYVDARNGGTFDMMIANDAQMSNTPWTYYDWMFQNPIADIATMQNGNYGRYDSAEAFALVDELDKIKVEDTEAMKETISKLQAIQLEDMPLIPLWYNGLWSQTSDAVWTNWPSAADGSNHFLPASWRGYWNMTSILMLTDLKPAEQQ